MVHTTLSEEARERLLNAYKALVHAHPNATERPVKETFAEIEGYFSVAV